MHGKPIINILILQCDRDDHVNAHSSGSVLEEFNVEKLFSLEHLLNVVKLSIWNVVVGSSVQS